MPSIDLDSFSLSSIDISLSSSQNNGRNKISACIATVFPIDDNVNWLHPETYFEDVNILSNFCAQFETCPTTSTLHIHMYIEFRRKHRLRFSQLCSILKQATGKPGDIQVTKRLSVSSRKSAVNYVLKNQDKTASFIWPNNTNDCSFDTSHFLKRSQPKPSKQDIDEERRLHIESKPRFWTWEQILHENEYSKQLLCTCSWGKTYHASRHAELPRRRIENVIILYGAGGTGKTTIALNFDTKEGEPEEERYYRRNADDGVFWGAGRTSYKGQRILHFEEFCGQESFSKLKEICDLQKFGPNVNIKNGGATLNHDTVIFTSNHHPSSWFKNVWSNDPKQFHPFWRRITQVWFFPPHRPDGSQNIPDSDNPPFYVDQTQDWVSFAGDYSSATDHATAIWPSLENYGSTSPNFNPV